MLLTGRLQQRSAILYCHLDCAVAPLSKETSLFPFSANCVPDRPILHRYRRVCNEVKLDVSVAVFCGCLFEHILPHALRCILSLAIRLLFVRGSRTVRRAFLLSVGREASLSFKHGLPEHMERPLFCRTATAGERPLPICSPFSCVFSAVECSEQYDGSGGSCAQCVVCRRSVHPHHE